MSDAAPAALGVYKPRRPQASPQFRLVSNHLHRLQTVLGERFAREYGPWRPVVGQVTDKFLACGVLDHGFARVRCDDCAHEYPLAFSCKCRYFCPSCPAQALGDLDAVAGHDAPRARAAPAGGTHYWSSWPGSWCTFRTRAAHFTQVDHAFRPKANTGFDPWRSAVSADVDHRA
jgi:hypothetical protein